MRNSLQFTPSLAHDVGDGDNNDKGNTALYEFFRNTLTNYDT